MRGLTVVAFYNNSDERFLRLLSSLQRLSEDVLGAIVESRVLSEIHATLLGLVDPLIDPRSDAELWTPELLDRVFRYRQEIDDVLLRSPTCAVRIGGYDSSEDYGFLSRGEILRERSFTVSGQQVVVVGWPECDGTVSARLDDIRKTAYKYGFKHKYYDSTNEFDPDAYFVIADLSSRPPEKLRNELERKGRELLDQQRVVLPLTTDNVDVIEYFDNHLPQSSSVIVG